MSDIFFEYNTGNFFACEKSYQGTDVRSNKNADEKACHPRCNKTYHDAKEERNDNAQDGADNSAHESTKCSANYVSNSSTVTLEFTGSSLFMHLMMHKCNMCFEIFNSSQ